MGQYGEDEQERDAEPQVTSNLRQRFPAIDAAEFFLERLLEAQLREAALELSGVRGALRGAGRFRWFWVTHGGRAPTIDAFEYWASATYGNGKANPRTRKSCQPPHVSASRPCTRTLGCRRFISIRTSGPLGGLSSLRRESPALGLEMGY